MHCERKLKLWSYNTIYCIIEGVTKASLSVGLKEESRLDIWPYLIINKIFFSKNIDLIELKMCMNNQVSDDTWSGEPLV
jgi:hypothetical protein